MLHPLFSTLVQRPYLVFDHVSAYGALISEEATQAGSDLVGRAIALILLILSTILFLGFGWRSSDAGIYAEPVSLGAGRRARRGLVAHDHCSGESCQAALKGRTFPSA